MKNFDLQQLAKDYLKYLDSKSNDDFEINETQFEKYKEVLVFFRTLTKDDKEAKIEIRLEPKETIGGLTCTTYLFDLWGETLKEFNKVLSFCSAMSIDALNDGKVCISMTIPDIFIEKQSRMMN